MQCNILTIEYHTYTTAGENQVGLIVSLKVHLQNYCEMEFQKKAIQITIRKIRKIIFMSVSRIGNKGQTVNGS